MGNPFLHVELMSNDVGNAKSYYGRLFDWKFEEMPMSDGSYTMIKVGEGTGGGLMKNPIPGASSAWLAYVLVSDIKAATSKARSLGASVMKDVTALLVAFILDAAPGGVPSPGRQVNHRWLDEFRGWVYGLGYGAQLGLVLDSRPCVAAASVCSAISII